MGVSAPILASLAFVCSLIGHWGHGPCKNGKSAGVMEEDVSEAEPVEDTTEAEAGEPPDCADRARDVAACRSFAADMALVKSSPFELWVAFLCLLNAGAVWRLVG